MEKADIEFPEDVYEFKNGGIIPAILDYTMTQAPRPNKPIALAGAITVAAHLMARRYIAEDGTSPNVYMIGLADSGCGKDFPRKVNRAIALECGLVGTVCDSFASGGGLEDAVLANTRVLSQYDEVDTLFRAMKKDTTGATESMSAMMLSLYGDSSSTHSRRQLSRNNVKSDIPAYCVNPHLSIFGTGIPRQFFSSMSDRMMTNGLFARCILLPSIGRPELNEAPYRPMSAGLVGYLQDFAGVNVDPATGKPMPPIMRADEKPQCVIVPFDDAAREMVRMSGADYDTAWEEAESDAERALLARSQEKVIKLATIFAVSENHIEPCITTDNILKARALVNYSNQKSLYLASIYCSESDYHELQQKILRLIADGYTNRREILRRLHIPAQEFAEVVGTLLQTGEIVPKTVGKASHYVIP